MCVDIYGGPTLLPLGCPRFRPHPLSRPPCPGGQVGQGVGPFLDVVAILTENVKSVKINDLVPHHMRHKHKQHNGPTYQKLYAEIQSPELP